MNPKSAKQARTGSWEVTRIFAYGSTHGEWVKQWDFSGGLSYSLEVPMNEIYAVKILHPLRTVDKLQGSSVPVRRHENSLAPIAYVENHCV